MSASKSTQPTPDDLWAEYNYRYQERLGILCGKDRPTPRQADIAHREAKAWYLDALLEKPDPCGDNPLK